MNNRSHAAGAAAKSDFEPQHSRHSPETTFTELGAEKLRALTDTLWPGLDSNPLTGIFRQLAYPWGSRKVSALPKPCSNIADDEAPFEFSMAFSKGLPEIQFYVEPQGDPPTPQTNVLVARALLDVVAAEQRAPLDWLRTVEDLFLPANPAPPFGLWIGASWSPGSDLLLKAYLNPQVRGRELSAHLVGTAFERLGLASAWSKVAPTLSLGDGTAELGIICLDLSRHGGRRAKVYVRHHHARLSQLQAVAGLTDEHAPSELGTFYSTLAGSSGPFLKKPPITEIALTERNLEEPSSVTLEFPIGSYVTNDDEARQRVERCLSEFGLTTDRYRAAIHAFAGRPLSQRAGLHAHVTLRRVQNAPRVAIYLASEAYVRTT